MAKVTALVAQKRNPNRVNVYLDGQFAFGLAAIEAARLHLGQELGEADLARVRQADDVAVAHERALRYLSYRPRSEAEVRKYLDGKHVAPEVIDEIVERLTRVGLLNDQAFAQYWRENRESFRPKGAAALRQELRQKGVPREVVDQALAGMNEEGAALDLARARARRLGGLDKLAFKRRLAAYLGRRGYAYDVVMPVVERVWQELGDATPAGAGDEVGGTDDNNEE
jgi:regulatory protein